MCESQAVEFMLLTLISSSFQANPPMYGQPPPSLGRKPPDNELYGYV
jgi:hypothetical protein